MERTPIERVLCPVDFSEFSVNAYKFALSVTQHYGATLYVQHVAELWKHPCACFAADAKQYNQFCERFQSSERERLHLFVQDHTPRGLEPECVTQEGMACDCILSFAQRESVNLIVIGTHGVRGFDRLTLGSVTEGVLRKARCAVLAVHGQPTAQAMEQAAADLREVIFCTDFSDDSNRALDYALSVAAEFKAKLTLVHVLDGIYRLHCEERRAKAYECLDRLIPEQMRRTQNITTMVRVGSASKEISQLACEKHADLAIMAVHGHNGLDRAMFGSTTYRVVQLVHCPVLAVHP
jgi:nucleotide-binding universal stress UspA family protein